MSRFECCDSIIKGQTYMSGSDSRATNLSLGFVSILTVAGKNSECVLGSDIR